jgi:TRAP-type C4-dicarboxylate transport system permease small subunit
MTHPGDLFYWMASLLLGVVTLMVVWSSVVRVDHGQPIIQIVPLAFAGFIWLLARLFRS